MILELITIALAVVTITCSLQDDKIFERVRKLIGYDGVSYPDNFIGNLYSCFMCLSFWVSLFCCILWLVYPMIIQLFAVRALAIIFWKRVY